MSYKSVDLIFFLKALVIENEFDGDFQVQTETFLLKNDESPKSTACFNDFLKCLVIASSPTGLSQGAYRMIKLDF